MGYVFSYAEETQLYSAALYFKRFKVMDQGDFLQLTQKNTQILVIGTEDQRCDDQFETASTGIKPLSTSEKPLIQRETHRDTNASLYNLQD